jgi:hypothetical protein
MLAPSLIARRRLALATAAVLILKTKSAEQACRTAVQP